MSLSSCLSWRRSTLVHSQNLLVLCTAFRARADCYPNLTVKKFPRFYDQKPAPHDPFWRGVCGWGHCLYTVETIELVPFQGNHKDTVSNLHQWLIVYLLSLIKTLPHIPHTTLWANLSKQTINPKRGSFMDEKSAITIVRNYLSEKIELTCLHGLLSYVL